MHNPEQENPLGLPTDTVTTGEYTEAFNGIKKFVDSDPNEVRNIQDLSARASLIGQYIHKVISSKGQMMYEFSVADGEEKLKYVFDKDTDKTHLLAYADGNSVFLRKYDDKKRANYFWNHGFSLKIPTDSDIVFCDPNKLEAVRVREKVYLREDQKRFETNPEYLVRGFTPLLKEGYAKAFYPLQYPYDIEHNQTFAILLHEF